MEINKVKYTVCQVLVPMLNKLRVLTFREIRAWTKSPLFALTFFVGPILWIFVFGNAFNSVFFSSGSTNAPLQGAPDYFNFISTGMFVAMPITFASRSGTSIFADRLKGYLDRLLVSPTPREVILLGKILGSVILGLVQAAVLVLVTLPFGLVAPNISVLSVIVLILSLIFLSYGFSALFVLVSMRIRRWATQQLAIAMISSPIMFVSSAFYPASRLPVLLRGLVELNPLTYAINITREVFFQGGVGSAQNLMNNFMVMIAFAAGMSVAIVFASRKWL